MNFENTITTLIGKWYAVISSLTQAGKIHAPYYEDQDHPEIPFYCFDWHAESGRPHTDREWPDFDQCRCVGIITHTSGTQDPTLPVDAYARTVTFELTSPEEYRSDIQEIFSEYALSLRTSSQMIGSQAVVFKSDSLPEFGEEFADVADGVGSTKMFRTRWSVLCVYFPEMRLSNDYTLKLSVRTASATSKATGYLQFTKLVFSDEAELRADSSANKNTRFRANTRQIGVQIEGLLDSSDISVALQDDIVKGDSFGLQYEATIYYKGTQLAVQEWARKSGSLVFAYGSFVAFSATFVRGF